MPLFCGLFGLVLGAMTNGPQRFFEYAGLRFSFTYAAGIRR